MGKTARQGPGWGTVFEGETTDPEVLAITHERPVVGFFWWLFGKCVKWASHVLFKLRVEGMENLPDRPYVHLSQPFQLSGRADPDRRAAVEGIPQCLLRRNHARFSAAGSMRRLAQFLHLIPVDPDSNLVPAMRAGAYGLRAGKILHDVSRGRALD